MSFVSAAASLSSSKKKKKDKARRNTVKNRMSKMRSCTSKVNKKLEKMRQNQVDMGFVDATAAPVFSQTEYDSNDGMLTTVWGPPMWHSLHTISFNYPVKPSKKTKERYRDFILSLKHVLPCGKCRKNLVKNFKQLPIQMKHMKSRDTFSKYVYDLHEVINTMLEKKSHLSYEDVRERYEHFRSRCARETRRIRKKYAKENGCTEPLVGEKSKCVLQIVPKKEKCKTFQMDKRCEKVRVV